MIAPVKSLPNGKILDWSKLIAFTDDKTNVAEMMIFSDSVENIVGKYVFISLLLQGR